MSMNWIGSALILSKQAFWLISEITSKCNTLFEEKIV